jgi:hypothetical protein
VCTGCKLLGSRLPLFSPLFGAPKYDPSNKREGRCALALGGRHFNDTHNNQTKDGFHITVDVGEDALPGRGVWGGCRLFAQGGKLNNKKTQKLKYVVALDGLRSIFFTQQPTKNKQAQWRRCRGRGSTRGGMHRGMKPSFWGALEVERR